MSKRAIPFQIPEDCRARIFNFFDDESNQQTHSKNLSRIFEKIFELRVNGKFDGFSKCGFTFNMYGTEKMFFYMSVTQTNDVTYREVEKFFNDLGFIGMLQSEELCKIYTEKMHRRHEGKLPGWIGYHAVTMRENMPVLECIGFEMPEKKEESTAR